MAKKNDLSKFLKPDLDGLRKAVIEELGSTQTAIATKLKSLKIKGSMSEPSSCPLANYLGRRGFDDARVDGNFEFNDGDLEMTMPKAYHKFVEAFDKGEYPELVDA